MGLFVLYWCGITLFMHSHVVNGVVVVHSHPFKAEHSHTKSQLETIFYLSILQTSGSVDAEVVLPFVARPLGGNRFRISLCPFFPSESGCLYAGTSC